MKIEVTLSVEVKDPILLHKQLEQVLFDSGCDQPVDLQDMDVGEHVGLLFDTILSGGLGDLHVPEMSSYGLEILDHTSQEIVE